MEQSVKEHMDFRSQKRMEMLKARAKRCVCKYCGGQLRLRRITFSQYEEGRIEIFCRDCDRIEFGVEPEIYGSAKYFVEETGFNCYPDLADNEKTKQMSMAKVCEILTWGNQNIGILTSKGFNIPLNMNRCFVGECVIFTEDDLEQDNIDI